MDQESLRQCRCPLCCVMKRFVGTRNTNGETDNNIFCKFLFKKCNYVVRHISRYQFGIMADLDKIAILERRMSTGDGDSILK